MVTADNLIRRKDINNWCKEDAQMEVTDEEMIYSVNDCKQVLFYLLLADSSALLP